MEAFLPISALISFKYWVLTGIFNHIHPSALVILLIIVLISITVKKAFCSWVCPIGLLSEYLAKIHDWIFGPSFQLPRWLDYPLRSLKYLLLLFFVWAVFFTMDTEALKMFIYSPYNRVADIKMYYFFAHMSVLTVRVLAALLLLSVLVSYFWCRYLCLYGALLGMLSWISLFKIHRNTNSCINCGKCTRVCPARVKVDQSVTVFSDECNACLRCVDICPVKDTLYMSVSTQKYKISRWVVLAIVIMTFISGTLLARFTGFWQNSINNEEYRTLIKSIQGPLYNH